MQTIHLQAVGEFSAKPAADLKPGDTTVWNYGSIAKVVSVRPKGKSVYVVLKDDKHEYPESRFLASRLVACTGLGMAHIEIGGKAFPA